MKLTLDTPVTVYEYDSITMDDLLTILRSSAVLAHVDQKTPKIAVVYDKTPLAVRDELIKALADRCQVVLLNQVEPNPRTLDIMTMYRDPAFAGSEIVLGMGGGSVLDSAKALAMLAANGGSLDEYLGNTPQRTITKAALPLILIPTTAGTGSEVTKVGVYTSAEGRKYTLGSPLMMAKSAILSGSILGSIPPKLCAATGFDALDHALESIWNKNTTDHTRKIAEAAAVEVLTWLPKAYENAVRLKNGETPNPQELASVSRNMLRASCMAGTAFSVTGTAAGHALSFVLSEDWHVPHGMACAFTLLDIFDLAAGEEATEISLERISQKLFPAETENISGGWKGKIKILRDRIAFLIEHMEISKTFKDLGVSLAPQNIDAHFSRSFTDPKMLNQLPKATKENIYPLLERKC